jgi:endo-1,4-beta-xylanase
MASSSRRQFLSFGLCAAAGCAFAADERPSLDALARLKGLRFGSAISANHLNDQKYCTVYRTECGVVVADNGLKWPEIEPSPDSYNFAQGDNVARFARKNGMLLRGHNLFWPRENCTPYWVTQYDFGARPSATAERLLERHIAKECAHYPEIHSWDVVNEAVDRETGELRRDKITAAMGEAAIDFCFHAARRSAPKAQLVYNDYMSWDFSSAAHRKGVLRLLEGLKTRGVPVDALGLQSHLGPHRQDLPYQNNAERTAAWREFLDQVVGMGFALLVTELTYRNKFLAGNAAAHDLAAEHTVRAYLDATLSYKQVGQVLTWGMVDKYAWAPTAAERADKIVNRPLSYDRDYRSKPLRDAIAAALSMAPSR